MVTWTANWPGWGRSLEFWLVVPICAGCEVCLQRLIIPHLAAVFLELKGNNA